MGTIASEWPANTLPINIPAEQMIKFLSRYKNLKKKSTNRNETAAKSPCKRLKLSVKKVAHMRSQSSTIINKDLYRHKIFSSSSKYCQKIQEVDKEELEESSNDDPN